ncbi:TIGR01777 family oxidoreductase [Streptomyces sp. PTM05]|uniref:TIGR01777 family oxidoreductase n=1 Tax=Streptantibioticus parmotrematis TaxID=2873249 RepID=A0ABS7QVA5_9ACTN|nr:TIGR01777 family oxidoreductase [Streptantibioticus parmotrematis]MBY8886275.1 TIGR01777 family oxidoreductase [Streptantibioticus parmotrematis]
MRIVVTGSAGLIGSALVRSLTADGHQVTRLVRREPTAPDEARWDPARREVAPGSLEGCDAVVNMAAAGVGDQRWTDAYKREIHDSRVNATATIAEAVAALPQPPKVLVCGTAIGFYGDTGEREVDESAPPADDFLARVCVDWEAAAAPAADAGVRTVFARTGLVVAREGGAWAKLFPVFNAGIGGRMGSGRQFWSFIALHDHIAALRHLIDTPELSGPVNLTGPRPVRNREVAAAMGRVLRRPALAVVPAPVLRLALGEFSGNVLGSQRVLPRRLEETGFRFAFPGIDEAIRAA